MSVAIESKVTMWLQSQWARFTLIGAAGVWIVLAILEDFLLAKLLSIAFATALVASMARNLQRRRQWVVWALMGALLVIPTKSVFLAAMLLLLVLLYPASAFPEVALLAVAKGVTIGAFLLYELGLLSPELDELSWQATHLLTQATNSPGILGVSQSHLIALLPAYIYLLVRFFSAPARLIGSLLVLIAVSLTALITNHWFWYGWAMVFAMWITPVRRYASFHGGRWRVVGATICGLLALALLDSMLHSFVSISTAPRVGVVEGGLKSLAIPPATPIQAPQEAQFGNLLQVLPLYGIKATKVPLSQLESALKSLHVLVVINPTQPFTPVEQRAIESFVRQGGALLVLGDHTDIGGIMKPTNQLLSFTHIRLKFDSAIPLDAQWQWKNCLRGGWHPMFYGRTNADFGISIGASLTVGAHAHALVLADRAFSDEGRPWYGISRLGNMQHDPQTEPLGGLVLVAEQRYGQGVVQVWGDTSGFQDGSLTENHAFVAALLDYLARFRTRPISRGFAVIAALLLTGLAIALLRELPLAIAILMISFTLGVHGIGWVGTHLWGARPRLQENRFALLDRSHGAYYPQSNTETRMYTFAETFLRAGLPLLEMRAFEQGIHLRPHWWVIVSPTEPYSASEARALKQYVHSGGNLLIIAGAPQATALHSLLQRFGMTITDSPVGAAHNARIVHTEVRTAVIGRQAISSNPPTQAAPYDAEISFKESYAIRGDSATIPLVQCWGHTLAQYKRLGRGRIVLIGDSRFVLDENLGQRESRNETAIRFLLAVLAEPQL